VTELSGLLAADKGEEAVPLHLVDKENWEAWQMAAPARARTLAQAAGFKPEAGRVAIVDHGKDGWAALVGVADRANLGPWCLARAAEALPEGLYRVAEGGAPGQAALGWLLGQYRFDDYRTDAEAKGPRVLLTGDPARIGEQVRLAEATALVRDLVNRPAADMGPAELEAETRRIAAPAGAAVSVTSGAQLDRDYPMVAAVGRAAAPAKSPRLIELAWGRKGDPAVVLVGKGVCFDSGGLDIKESTGMRLMKKDMGGAAHALALAWLAMAVGLPIRLHLIIPAVENAISGDAFRPGDVLKSRKGLSVEIGNTDAEGRLVLADALARAGELEPALILDFATLTGAARVALGPDLPALFANDEAVAEALIAAGNETGDPVWRMPLWRPYDELFASDVADLSNASEGAFAGAITAALFLARFVDPATPWAHLDTFAWRPSAKPGRPKGGDALGLRAAWGLLTRLYPREKTGG